MDVRVCMVLTTGDRHGAQGTLDTASNSTLENEFGSSKAEDVIQQILEKGTIQETEVRHFLPSVLALKSFALLTFLIASRTEWNKERQHWLAWNYSLRWLDEQDDLCLFTRGRALGELAGWSYD